MTCQGSVAFVHLPWCACYQLKNDSPAVDNSDKMNVLSYFFFLFFFVCLFVSLFLSFFLFFFFSERKKDITRFIIKFWPP